MGNNQTQANALQTFAFESQGKIRVINIDGLPWFVAADVCRALQFQNTSKAVSKLSTCERSKFKLDRNPNFKLGRENQSIGNDEAWIINESGLYFLMLRCRDAVNEGTLPWRFRMWVTSEVLPAIRKTGNYGVLPQPSVTEQDYRDLKMLYDMQKRMSEMFQKQCHYYMDLCNERTDRLIERSDMLVKVITGTM